jgi:hypothetical protein
VFAAAAGSQGDMQHCCMMQSDATSTDTLKKHSQHCQKDQKQAQQHNCDDDCSMCGSCAHTSIMPSDESVGRLTIETTIDTRIPHFLAFQPDLNLRPPI